MRLINISALQENVKRCLCSALPVDKYLPDKGTVFFDEVETRLFNDSSDEVGYFDEDLPTHEDWDLWIRMSEVCDFVHVPMMTCVVDQTQTGMMHDAHSMNRGHEMVMAKYE